MSLNKRQFLKTGLCSLCGLAVGASHLDLVAKGLDKIAPAENQDDIWKWSREAMHYIKTPRGIKCKLCPQACDIKESETGECHTRTAQNDKLICIAYGNPCAVHVDPIEKKPLYHFKPGSKAYSVATAGCNLACLNCQNWTISQVSPMETRNMDLMPDKVVSEAMYYGCSSIAYTYSDPVAFYEYTYDTCQVAHRNGIRNVFISAGYINEEPLRQLAPYLDAANIDLKSFDNEIYEMLNAGTLQPVLDTLKILYEEGVWLEITNLVVPEWTDKIDMIRKMCDWLYDNGLYNCPLHFSRFTPMYKLSNLPPTPKTMLEDAFRAAKESGMKYVYIGNVPGHSGENTACPSCEKIILERTGYKIGKNHIREGKCKFCGEVIPGVW